MIFIKSLHHFIEVNNLHDINTIQIQLPKPIYDEIHINIHNDNKLIFTKEVIEIDEGWMYKPITMCHHDDTKQKSDIIIDNNTEITILSLVAILLTLL